MDKRRTQCVPVGSRGPACLRQPPRATSRVYSIGIFFRVQGLGFRDQGSRTRVKGLTLRPPWKIVQGGVVGIIFPTWAGVSGISLRIRILGFKCSPLSDSGFGILRAQWLRDMGSVEI